MRVALLTETYARRMGYLQNVLPRFMARQGVDMHVVSLDLPPYHDTPEYGDIYRDLMKDDDLKAGTVERVDGVTLHILGHRKRLGYARPIGLFGKLREIEPQVVQTMAVSGWIPLLAALYRPLLRYRLFTACHMPAAAFAISDRHVRFGSVAYWHRFLRRRVVGSIVSSLSDVCYGANADCTAMAVRYYGVPVRKGRISYLGVDPDVFYPSSNGNAAERARVRAQLGFGDDDIVCIFTGRFFEQKNPVVLARAIARLRASGQPFKGLFIGNGTQRSAIAAEDGCITHAFVAAADLGRYYRAADIGVWPSGQSMSVLDAAACGIPVVVPDSTLAVERYQGHGATYRENDVDDLVRVLYGMADPTRRAALGRQGALSMRRQFTWEAIAAQRLEDYAAAIDGGFEAVGRRAESHSAEMPPAPRDVTI